MAAKQRGNLGNVAAAMDRAERSNAGVAAAGAAASTSLLLRRRRQRRCKGLLPIHLARVCPAWQRVKRRDAGVAVVLHHKKIAAERPPLFTPNKNRNACTVCNNDAEQMLMMIFE
jgi:hypothetical protein